MVAQHHAPCGRAVCRVAGGRHSLITDKMFRRAIERQPRRIFAQRRHLMYHSGPLESRRRLGKRTLSGAIHPHTHPVPSWHIEVLSNATWEWHTPTTSEERRIKSREISISNIWRKFLKWLEMSDADKPFILPPQDIDECLPFSKTIKDLRLNISSLSSNDSDAVLEFCRDFCATIQKGILNEELSTEDMLLGLAPFDSASAKVVSNMRIDNDVRAMLRSSVAKALETTQINRPGAVPDSMWLAMFDFVVAINANFHDVSCFNRLMTAMPESAKMMISDEKLFTYVKSFVGAQIERSHRNPYWPWCCSKIGSALTQLTEDQRLSLFSRMKYCVDHGKLGADMRQLGTDMRQLVSFPWLLIRAYDESLSDEAFVQIYKESSDGRADKDGYRIWQLALARLRSNGTLSHEAHMKVASWDFNDTLAHRWRSVTETLLATPRPEVAIASLSAFLTDIDETWHLVKGLIEAHNKAPCAELLQFVASACGKLDIDVALRIALNNTNHGEHLLDASQTDPGEDPFSAFMAYPRAESHAWRAMKLSSGTPASKVELIDVLSHEYAKSPNLSKSQKIRRAQRTVAYQKALVGQVTPTVMGNATRVLTLDLDEGHWGRSRLLRWLVAQIRDQISPEAAQKTTEQLNGWRQLIHNANRGLSAPYTSELSASEYDNVGGGRVTSSSKQSQVPDIFDDIARLRISAHDDATCESKVRSSKKRVTRDAQKALRQEISAKLQAISFEESSPSDVFTKTRPLKGPKRVQDSLRMKSLEKSSAPVVSSDATHFEGATHDQAAEKATASSISRFL